ncbi:unnamed protein product, partial [Urochloa humidicola]
HFSISLGHAELGVLMEAISSEIYSAYILFHSEFKIGIGIFYFDLILFKSHWFWLIRPN